MEQINSILGGEVLFKQLLDIFPNVAPAYLRRICVNKLPSAHVLNQLIQEVLAGIEDKSVFIRCTNAETNPPNSNPIMNFKEQLEDLKQMLPDADPIYLEDQCSKIKTPKEFREFVSGLIELHRYPTKKEYLKKQQLLSEKRTYTTEFNVTEFLKVIPDPEIYFRNKKRETALDHCSLQYVFTFFMNEFVNIPISTIISLFNKHQRNVYVTYKNLENLDSRFYLQITRIKKTGVIVPDNIPLLQEIAFIKYRQEIAKEIKARNEKALEEKRQAKKAELLLTCNCCFDEEIVFTDIYECEKGCIFCKACIRKSTEIAFGQGKIHFKCLTDCSSHFSLKTLQAVLDENMFKKVALKHQLEEVMSANIEDIELCPCCDFATIPPEGDKVFHCLNPECLKETCRLCKEPVHIPLRCDEVEKDEEVNLRTYIENKMTEALLRKCYKCGIPFIKNDGCNKITCSCGAKMCYICGQPVTDYNHFNGLGGDKYDLCPLYSDTNLLHKNAVQNGAKQAKEEKGLDIESSKLKVDPSLNISNFF